MSCVLLPKLIYIEVIVVACVYMLCADPSKAGTATVSCSNAAAHAEQNLMLPAGLLNSIGLVETGNQPWSVNVDGVGHSFSSAGDAVNFVRSVSLSGAHYVDVGCFQIDLLYHPDAFTSLESAFDPVSNAMAAGRFLLSLNQTTSSWFQAVGRFHSSIPLLAVSYARRVYAAVNGTASLARQPKGDFDTTLFGIQIVVPGEQTNLHEPIVHFVGLPTIQTP